MKKEKKTSVKTEYHNWTKEEMRTLYKIWDKKSVEEIAEELNLSRDQVKSMACQMRKNGIPLEKKRIRNKYFRMILELKKELKIK